MASRSWRRLQISPRYRCRSESPGGPPNLSQTNDGQSFFQEQIYFHPQKIIDPRAGRSNPNKVESPAIKNSHNETGRRNCGWAKHTENYRSGIGARRRIASFTRPTYCTRRKKNCQKNCRLPRSLFCGLKKLDLCALAYSQEASALLVQEAPEGFKQWGDRKRPRNQEAHARARHSEFDTGGADAQSTG